MTRTMIEVDSSRSAGNVTRCVLALLLLQLALSECQAELLPEEVAIIAARGSRDSEDLAKYYAQQRGIPAANICVVDMPRGETIDRERWRWAVRPEIAKWLAENDPQGRLKCLVTTYDVPLRIGAAPAAELDEYRQFLEGERLARYAKLNEIQEAFANVAADAIGVKTEDVDSASSAPSADGEPGPQAKLDGTKHALEKALQAAQARAATTANAQQRQGQQLQIQQLAGAVGGINVLLGALGQKISADVDAPAELRSDFDLLRGRLTGLAESKGLLDQMPPNPQRDALIAAIIDRANGLTATIQWLDEQLAAVAKNETGASFDSELSLILWDDGYELLRWQPNFLRANLQGSSLGKVRRVLMVSRLDAPTIQLAKRLIDDAIRVEKEGLTGKAYFDARGLAQLDDAQLSPGSYEDYDRALLLTAKGIKEQTDIEVVLDEKPTLLQPGEAPEAALYCGWYSLAKYVDAFDWAPGAVGYHLASSEAATLRKADSLVWCKRMIEEGVAATIGPVYEPYLYAFPRPEEFFALLLQGDLTLVECYYQTKPFNSWMMTLIGDPLYRPFKNRALRASGSDGASTTNLER